MTSPAVSDGNPSDPAAATLDSPSDDAGAPPPATATLPYELRIGVTGHRDLADASAVKRAVRALLDRIVDTLQNAAREPLGEHGSPLSRVERIDRRLTWILAAATCVLCPLLTGVFFLLALPFRLFGLRIPFPTRWPTVPLPRRLSAEECRTPIKLTVVTALAAGADQIVTEVVHEMVQDRESQLPDSAEKRNRYLEAVLPLAVDDYEQDFAPGPEREKFHELLKLDRGRLGSHPQPTILFGDASSQPRWKAYAAAGRYVVDASEILIAVWDPDREEKPGGTAETVRYALEGGRTVLWLNPTRLDAGARLLRTEADVACDERPSANWWKWLGTQWHRFWHEPLGVEEPVVESADVPTHTGLSAHVLPTQAKWLSPMFHRLAAYNRDCVVGRRTIQRETAEEQREFTGDAGDHLPGDATNTLVNRVVPHRVRADLLSRRYRELRDFSAEIWPKTAALAVTLMAFQILFLPAWYWLAWIELGLLLICYVTFRVSLHEAWHEKWLNDRQLAEGLREALYTSLVPSRDIERMWIDRARSRTTSRHLTDDPLPFYDPSQAWFVGVIKRLLRREQRRFWASISDVNNLPDIANFISDHWLRQQAKWQIQNAVRLRERERRSRRFRLLMVVLILLTAAAHALGVGHSHDGHLPASFSRFDLWVAFFTVVFPIWAAAFHAIASADDPERLAHRADRMGQLLNGLAARTSQATTHAELLACVAEAEQLMDVETREWAQSLSERKPEFTG